MAPWLPVARQSGIPFRRYRQHLNFQRLFQKISVFFESSADVLKVQLKI
jgi:hypothetical protein